MEPPATIAAVVEMLRKQHKKLCLLSTRQRDLIQSVQRIERAVADIQSLLQQRVGEPHTYQLMHFEQIKTEEEYTAFVEDSASADFRENVVSVIQRNYAIQRLSTLLSDYTKSLLMRTRIYELPPKKCCL